MSQVKQAAEAAREKYAESRALKQQSKRYRGALFTAGGASSSRSNTNTKSRHRFSEVMNPNENIAPNLLFATMCSNTSTATPEIPDVIQEGFAAVLGLGNLPSKDKDTYYKDGADSYSYSGRERGHGHGRDKQFHNSIDIETSKETGLVRQLSRQRQLEERIDSALQKLNEHDEEGRSLPEELTADDVGRTVLRRANVDDIHWVEKLFGTTMHKSKPSSPTNFHSTAAHTTTSPLFGTILASDKGPSSMSMKLWSNSTIVLLLCRAIAPHEDPPLGCAVLTLGFSMQKGKILRIAQLASKSHQPRERFIETLSEFATNMGCSLISSPSKTSFATLEKDSLQRILNIPPLPAPDDALEYRLSLRQEVPHRSKTMIRNNNNKNNNIVELHHMPMSSEENRVKPQPSLQSVQEEGEGVEESDNSSSPKDKKEKRREKPSKRSRFE